jgi:hypothetical protein
MCESIAGLEPMTGMLTEPVIVLQSATLPLVTVICRIAT